MKNIVFCLFVAFVISNVHGDDDEEVANLPPPPPPKPYAFGYAAGRFPGHIDRTHSEVSDGSGVVQGSYSYVDPTHQIRKVDYIADRNGFHPILNQNPPSLPNDTPVVAAAKAKHLQQFASIADSHQDIGAQQPVETYAVQAARNQHLALFQQIANQHAQLAADQQKNEEPAEDYSNFVNY